jgi:hypothetical protein
MGSDAFDNVSESPTRAIPTAPKSERPCLVCSYEDRAAAMDSVLLMGESLCRADPEVSLHLMVPDAPASVRSWAERRPEVILTTTAPDGVTGWDVKPWLLLQELSAGRRDAVWLDDDIIVSRPISTMLEEFPPDSLIVAQDWQGADSVHASQLWGLRSVRPCPLINTCFIRATEAHRPLLERWLKLMQDPGYRAAQSVPWERRPLHLSSDQWLLSALLESEDFSHVPFEYIRLGRHIAQCAGSSGYRPQHRLLDLFRGLPPLIHCIGRKPWVSIHDRGRMYRFLTDLATDVSPYVLASRKVARQLDMSPAWLDARTRLGALLRGLTAYHPGMAGLPLATLHSLHLKISQALKFGKS